MKSPVDEHAELVQQVSALTERATRVSATLAEAGRALMQRRTLPTDTLVDEIAAVHTDFSALRDRVVAAATTLAAGAPPPVTTLRELEVLVKVLVDDGVRRARRSAEEKPEARPVVEAKARTPEAPPRTAPDETRRKAAEAEQEWGRAEAEAKRRSEEEAQRRAAEEARHKAEADARHKAAAAEAARRQAEDEARRKAVEAEGTRRKAAEAEAKRKAEEEAKRKEDETKRKAEEDARRKAAEAEETRRKAAEAEGAKRKADQEAQQDVQRRTTEEAKRKAEEETRRKAAEAEETRRKAAEAEAAKRKADQEAQQEAQRRAAAEAEQARRRAEQEAAAAAAEPAAAEPTPAEDEGADAGLETAQWWISASASWGSMRSKKVGFAAAVNDVLTKYPYFLSVPIQTSADHEDGMMAYGYGILLEHIEQHVPGFVADALARLPARSGVSLGKRLYDYLAQALGTGYGEFIKTVLLAAVPKTPPWATGGIEDSEGTTTVFVRPSARIGDTHQKAERFTQAGQRFGEHHFTAAVPPLTTRFFRIEALDVKEARHLGLRISEKGVPSDQAWVVTMAARGGAPQAKRHVPQGTVISGIGRDISSVWVGLFNADAENEKRYDVAVEVTRRQPGTGGFRKSR